MVSIFFFIQKHVELFRPLKDTLLFPRNVFCPSNHVKILKNADIACKHSSRELVSCLDSYLHEIKICGEKAKQAINCAQKILI